MKIIGLVGNNATFSHNRLLLQYMQKQYGSDVAFTIHEIKDIPLFNVDNAKNPPEAVRSLSQAIEAADGVVIATPEYDHTIPAALKSVIEWLSCATHPFTGKPVMIVGASLGIQGTVRAQMNLRQIMNSPGVHAHVLTGNEFLLNCAKDKFDASGNITCEATAAFLTECFANFRSFITQASTT